jgi:hypothetical protein
MDHVYTDMSIWVKIIFICMLDRYQAFLKFFNILYQYLLVNLIKRQIKREEYNNFFIYQQSAVLYFFFNNKINIINY